MNLASPSIERRRLRLSRDLSVVGKLALVLMSLVFAFSLGGGGDAIDSGSDIGSVVAAPFFVIGLGAIALSYILPFVGLATPGDVVVGADELVVTRSGRSTSYALASLRSAYVVERGGTPGVRPIVEIELPRGDMLAVDVDTVERARELVSALGFGLRKRRAHYRLALPARRFLNVPIAYLAYVLASTFASVTLAFTEAIPTVFVALGLFLVAGYPLLKRAFAAPELVVGDDGVLIRRGLRKRFFRYEDLASVRAQTTKAVLLLDGRDGKVFPVMGVLVDGERRFAAGALIAEHLRAARVSPDKLPRFERAGEGVAGWRAALARVMGDRSYREASITIDDASAVLASPAASAEQRVGAAIALRVAGEPPARIRVAAEGAVDERLRAALEAAAQDDDAAIEAALRRVVRR